MEEKLVIGEIVKPQGILGEMKIKPYTDDVSRFRSLKQVYVSGEAHRVLNARIAADAVYLSLSGVPDRTAAERLRGRFLEVPREDAAPLPEGRYYIVDVLGSALLTETGERLGVITDIRPAYVDLYTIWTETGKTATFPLLKDVLLSVDVLKKEVVVSAKRFGEIAVYED